ncbi:hypothetical protein OC25_17765 [Pedobacter kyungheensis]|uniref:AbiV family abortive infection protein n=1 Tax=Pedobacter kyungheensis TaxID=1069985 RepID=A0A0C1FWN3_9SPHI|nr:AbiV family abortive infection protein [Pedobacter kyungheensis]KIA92279.1 hypothetical protein OC25_17765 [Pedobacter kyungheensis]
MNPKSQPVRSWTSLTPREYTDIVPIVIKNAKRHFLCADILAQNDQSQNAISHLILGSEELVKSFWCLLMSRNINLKQLPWFTKLFYNHKVRHELLKDFFSVYLFVFNSTLPTRSKGDSLLKNIQILLSRSVSAYGNYNWWKRADDLKQQTFYVDFKDGILDPSSFTKADYHIALNYITLFKEDMGKLIAKVNSLSDQELHNLIDEFQFFEIDKLRQEAYKSR